MRHELLILLVTSAEVATTLAGTVGGQSENLLVNQGFEEWSGIADYPVIGWRYYTSGKRLVIGRETNVVREGSSAVRFDLQGVAHAAQGLVQHVAVVAGSAYEYSAWVRSAPNSPMSGTGRIELGVEWRDEFGREISRVFDTGGVGPISRLKWQRAVLSKLKAPKGAVEAVVGVHVLDGEAGGKGAVLVDHLEWVEK